MQMTRRGVYRDCGVTELVTEGDGVSVQADDDDGITMRMRAIRYPQSSSYRYELILTAEDVLKLLFTLAPEAIAVATAQLREEFDLAEIIPEIQKQLTCGAFQSQSAVLAAAATEHEEHEEADI